MNNIYIPPVVKNLLIINVIFFIATWVFQQQGINLEALLGVFYLFSPNFNIWQPITYMFMHADITHIFFNMFALYMFGGVLESRWGTKRFIYFYLITGLGALALQYVVQGIEVYQIAGHFNPDLNVLKSIEFTPKDTEKFISIYSTPMVGASGAIFGLMVAFGMLYPNVELYIMFIPVPVKAKYFIPVYVLIELFLGVSQFKGDSVAHFAHLGGALIGFLLVKLWKDKNTFYNYYE